MIEEFTCFFPDISDQLLIPDRLYNASNKHRQDLVAGSSSNQE